MNDLSSKLDRVLIVDDANAKQHQLYEIVHELGFQHIDIVSDGPSALRSLLNTAYTWVINPLLLGQSIDALQLLKVITQQPELRNTRMSLFYQASEDKFVDAAFSLGLMSCHPVGSSRDELLNILRIFVTQQHQDRTRLVLLSLDQLRLRLLQKGALQELIGIEKRVFDLFPGSAKLLVQLGELHLSMGNIAKGIATISQAVLIDEKLKDSVHANLRKIAKDHGLNLGDIPSSYNALGIDSCVIIDSDTAVQGALGELLRQLGVPRIEKFEQSEDAWQWLLANPNPDLILQEWKLSQPGGPALLQRIRQRGFYKTIIVGVTAAIRDTDAFLLREISFDGVVAKPFSQNSFIKNLIWILQQNRLPTDLQMLERKIQRHLACFEFSEAMYYRVKLFEDRRTSVSTKKFIEALIAYNGALYQEAKDNIIEALKLQNNSLVMLALLGKTLIKLQDYSSSVRIFERISLLSSFNVEHLCNLALAYFETENLSKAEVALARAKEIDKGNMLIWEVECQYEIFAGNSKKVKKTLSELQLADSLYVLEALTRRASEWRLMGQNNRALILYREVRMLLPSAVPREFRELLQRLRFDIFEERGRRTKDKQRMEAEPMSEPVDVSDTQSASPLSTQALMLKDEASLEQVAKSKLMLDQAMQSASRIQGGEICLYGLCSTGLDLPEVIDSLCKVDIMNKGN